MNTTRYKGPRRLTCGWLAACALAFTSISMVAQTPSVRIRTEINSSEMSQIKSLQQPLARAEFDAGRVPPDTRLNGMSIVFKRSAAQEAALEALLAAQQDPTSPQYHQWLSPDQFAARFGMAQADLDKVQTWLQQQGFSIDSVARSRNMIRFSGTAGQVEQAFQTQMHFYNIGGEKHFAPATVLSVPAAMASTVQAVRNLSDFRPKPMHIQPRSAFTSSQSGNVYFSPGDIAVTYDISPLYSAGVDGNGQTIAVIGQSAIQNSDIENFQKAAGLSVKDPVSVIVPGSGSSTVVSGGDEGESDLDIEWSGATAKGATIDFVYTGNSPNFNAYDAIQYAVDEKIGNIISISYGTCETALGTFSLESTFQQAAAQGQSVLAASGDQGSTACSGDTQNGLTTTQQFAIAVNYPASSPYVTGVGGTEISAADSTSSNSTYWSGKTATDTIVSAKTYIPEIVWNDNSTSGLSASGGGKSALFSKPSWQTGVSGIPSDGKRDVPDVALYSSPNYPGYLFCTSDSSDWAKANGTNPAQVASCNNGFRDSTTGYLTVAGGTSFATPIFAGMIALINQKQQWTEGQGLANTTLYKLASNAGTYASAFHDVTSGNNNCTAGSQFCGTTTTGFTAGPGYDQVTGLGSVDLANLLAAWPPNPTPVLATTTTVAAASSTPNVSTDDVITITVAEAGGTGTPGGTVNLSIDGGGTSYGKPGSTQSVTLSNGSATYTANFGSTGVHTIVAQYQGDSTHAASTGSMFVTVGGGSSGNKGFAMSFSPATLTVKQGASGSETLTVTPSGGYTGNVTLKYSTSNDTALSNLCLFAGTGFNSDTSFTVSNSSPATGQLTIDTNAADCASTPTGGVVTGRGLRLIPHIKGSFKASNNIPTKNGRLPAGMALAGLLLAGFLGRSSRKLRQLACVIALASLSLAVSACGGSSSGTTNQAQNPAKGTYTITFSGTDSSDKSLTSQSSFSLVIN
jgi:subtilase family serine protease